MMQNFSEFLEEHGVDESGFSTVELLGNAALGVIALVGIWAALKAVGVDVVNLIKQKIITENTNT